MLLRIRFQKSARRANPTSKGQLQLREGRANPKPEKGRPTPTQRADPNRKGQPVSSFFLHQHLNIWMLFVIMYYYHKSWPTTSKTEGPTPTRRDNPTPKGQLQPREGRQPPHTHTDTLNHTRANPDPREGRAYLQS